MHNEARKKGMRQSGLDVYARKAVKDAEIPRTVPIRKARMDVPDSDFSPFGRLDGWRYG